MQAYSMDLRERALLDSDAGMKAADVAVKYRVSGSWVRLLKQRRRETGEVAPRVQRHGRRRMLEPHLHTLAALIAEQPDRLNFMRFRIARICSAAGSSTMRQGKSASPRTWARTSPKAASIS